MPFNRWFKAGGVFCLEAVSGLQVESDGQAWLGLREGVINPRQQKTRTRRVSCLLSRDLHHLKAEGGAQRRNRTVTYRQRIYWDVMVLFFVDAPKNAPKTKSTPSHRPDLDY